MEETHNSNGDVSVESLPSTLNGRRPRINPHANNGLRAAHHDVSNDKHSYWRGRGAWDRSTKLPNSHKKITDPSRTTIDTKAPFESVKDAVNMFGGNADWKAQRALTKERSRNFERELEKVEQELPLCQRHLEVAEDAKASVLQELEITKKQVEGIHLQIERALTEETQAQQDSELAQLRVKEMERGIGDEDSTAVEAQVAAVRASCLEADDELKFVEAELDELKKECEKLMKERDAVAKKAEEAALASGDAEKRVDELAVEFAIVKETLESAHSSHLKAEEQRRDAVVEREQGNLNWEQKLKESQEELNSLEEKLAVVNDVKLKFETATSFLNSLRWQFAASVDSEIVRDEKQVFVQPDALSAAKKELEEAKSSIEKAKGRVNCLRIAAFSLKSELEAETSTLSSLREKEKMSSLAISSLEAELEKNKSEQEKVQGKEKKSNEEMREYPQELQEKAEETDEAKSKAHSALRELTEAMEEAELAKASASTLELRLQAVLKEIEATKTSEKLALEAVKAIQGSEETTKNSQAAVSISFEEYYALSKKASEAERLSNEKVMASIDQIKDAKREEKIIREKLEAAFMELKQRKEGLRDATEKAVKATEGKLKVEQQLRDWRAENQQRRKACEAFSASSNGEFTNTRIFWKSFDDGKDINGSNSTGKITLRVNSAPDSNRRYPAGVGDGQVGELRQRKKRSFFPRIAMYLARKKTQPVK